MQIHEIADVWLIALVLNTKLFNRDVAKLVCASSKCVCVSVSVSLGLGHRQGHLQKKKKNAVPRYG